MANKLEVVIMMTSSAANDDEIITMTALHVSVIVRQGIHKGMIIILIPVYPEGSL